MEDLIKKGADAFRAGNRDDARKFLASAVKLYPDNEQAWGWLYNVADNDKERIYCLKQILRINPNNNKVRELFVSLTNQNTNLKYIPQVQVKKCPYCAEEILIEAIVCKHCGRNLAPQNPAMSKSSAKPAKEQPVKKTDQSLLIFIGILVVLFIFFCGFSILSQTANPTQNFSKEEWRSRTIEKFGPETVESDGSKLDYVRLANSICNQNSSERISMKANLGVNYEGSLQQFIIETYCPYAN